MRDLAGDVLALMDTLGIERASLVGHSMGSFVAQQVALAAPGRVERLMLVGYAPSIHSMAGIDGFTAALNALQDPVPEQFAREFQVSTIHHPIPNEFLDTAVATSLRLPARVWRGIMAGMLARPRLRSSIASASRPWRSRASGTRSSRWRLGARCSPSSRGHGA